MQTRIFTIVLFCVLSDIAYAQPAPLHGYEHVLPSAHVSTRARIDVGDRGVLLTAGYTVQHLSHVLQPLAAPIHANAVFLDSEPLRNGYWTILQMRLRQYSGGWIERFADFVVTRTDGRELLGADVPIATVTLSSVYQMEPDAWNRNDILDFSFIQLENTSYLFLSQHTGGAFHTVPNEGITLNLHSAVLPEAGSLVYEVKTDTTSRAARLPIASGAFSRLADAAVLVTDKHSRLVSVYSENGSSASTSLSMGDAPDSLSAFMRLVEGINGELVLLRRPRGSDSVFADHVTMHGQSLHEHVFLFDGVRLMYDGFHQPREECAGFDARMAVLSDGTMIAVWSAAGEAHSDENVYAGILDQDFQWMQLPRRVNTDTVGQHIAVHLEVHDDIAYASWTERIGDSAAVHVKRITRDQLLAVRSEYAQISESLEVYPHPVSAGSIIRIPRHLQGRTADIRLYDHLGRRRVDRSVVLTAGIPFPYERLRSGLYLLELQCGSERYQKRVLR